MSDGQYAKNIQEKELVFAPLPKHIVAVLPIFLLLFSALFRLTIMCHI